MKTKQIIVVPYDEKWPDEFQKIKAELERAIQDDVITIEHVGSTSVEGLSAKPIIDIDVVIPSEDCFASIRKKLEEIGYRHEGDLGIHGREAFKYQYKEHLMKHHLYICPQNSRELHRHITFRNYLRTHKEAAVEYGKVKMQAALLYPTDIDGYMAHKSPCIESIYKKCGLTK